ncbi:hypothetical protein ILUMI_02842 [Ignelater luminosus]|uniref:Cytochrome P450 n=1 Tax=Ignelater luminosus TaxID=2038154 RepID=A0A8K0GL07_IGNLU|nr:hypothetical protein ILUMI_02842 [Ignelater luminosus]
MLLITAFFIILLIFFCFTGIIPILYWKRRKVPHLMAWPYFGNRISHVFHQHTMLDVLNKHYQAFREKRYFGFYNMCTPVLILRDLKLIKQITVEEFDSFPEHRRFIPDELDRLWSKNLFAMRGDEKWKSMRATLTPFFTGSKLKMMFGLMKSCSNQFTNHFLSQNQLVTVELKDAFTRLANDVIAITAFGVSCNSLENKTNEFYLMGKVISNVTGWRSSLQNLYQLSPTLYKFLGYPFYPKKEKSFFENLVNEIVKLRKNKGLSKVDVIHSLIEAKNKKDSILTNEDITAQVMIFFFAGFESISTMLCYTCYELAINPDVQENLYKEISVALRATNGDITYDMLMNIQYLGNILDESLRKWPPFNFIDRCSIKPFTIKPKESDEKSLYLEAGTVCIIPVLSIQRDPKYYPDPERFDPERFSKANKQVPYFSFGVGQRNCIGSRFALLEGRLIIAELIRKFKIVPVEKTEIPLVMNKGRNNAIPSNGFWLGLKPRR